MPPMVWACHLTVLNQGYDLAVVTQYFASRTLIFVKLILNSIIRSKAQSIASLRGLVHEKMLQQ